MLLRIAGLFLLGLSLAAASAAATPEGQQAGDSVVIPFEPPLGETLRYRWERAEKRGDETTMSWSVDTYRFEEVEGGYRLFVEPVSSGSNEDDPIMLELARKLDQLIKLPYVLRVNEDAEIVELERGDEYWAKIIEALTSALKTMEPKRPGHDKMIEGIIGLYSDMSPEARLAKLTEPVQPMVEFGWTEPSLAEPVITTLETASPLGPVKQNISVTLTKVSDGFAHLTVRSSIPTEALRKLTSAMFDRMNNGAIPAADVAKLKMALAAAKDFNAETVADYKVSVEDGLLETFHSTQTITMTESDKPVRRTKSLSVTRIE